MIISSVLAATRAGLMSTFKSDSDNAYWIGYQDLAVIGVGLGMQQPLIVVQTILDITMVPVGTSIIFLQTPETLFVSIGQNILSNELFRQLVQHAPQINLRIVL
ncbi:hypothetical protein BJ878DRAFT_392140, partial [Calycina marina]